jgi:hypothetical protein
MTPLCSKIPEMGEDMVHKEQAWRLQAGAQRRQGIPLEYTPVKRQLGRQLMSAPTAAFHLICTHKHPFTNGACQQYL